MSTTIVTEITTLFQDMTMAVSQRIGAHVIAMVNHAFSTVKDINHVFSLLNNVDTISVRRSKKQRAVSHAKKKTEKQQSTETADTSQSADKKKIQKKFKKREKKNKDKMYRLRKLVASGVGLKPDDVEFVKEYERKHSVKVSLLAQLKSEAKETESHAQE